MSLLRALRRARLWILGLLALAGGCLLWTRGSTSSPADLARRLRQLQSPAGPPPHLRPPPSPGFTRPPDEYLLGLDKRLNVFENGNLSYGLPIAAVLFDHRNDTVRFIFYEGYFQFFNAPFTCLLYDHRKRLIGSLPGATVKDSVWPPIGVCYLPSEHPVPSFLQLNVTNFPHQTLRTAAKSLLPIAPLTAAVSEEAIPEGLAVCLCPLWNTNDWLLLTQFLEYYRLQGASRVFVYEGPVAGAEVKGTLRALADRHPSLLSVVPWREAVWCDPLAHCQRVMLQHCLYRSMYRYRRVVMTDVDELVMVNFGRTRLIDWLQSPDYQGYGSIGFRLRVFARFRGDPPASNVTSAEISSLVPLWRYSAHVSALAPEGFGQKYICKPHLLESVFVHYPQRWVPKAPPKGWTTIYPDKEPDTFLAHFRTIPGWENWYNETKKFGNYTALRIPNARLLENLTSAARYVFHRITPS